MMRLILTLALVMAAGTALAGCRASGEVDPGGVSTPVAPLR